MALIGVSRAWSPRRSTAASSRDAAIARPRLHQVRPTQEDRATATRTPVSTAPIRTTPIRTLEYAEACSTSRAVSAPVRSMGPEVSRRVSR